MKVLRGSMAATAALLGMAHGAAAATQAATPTTPPPCLTRTEAQGVIAFALPSVVGGLNEKCRPSLPATAYLPRNAASLASRFRPASDSAWPTARTAFQKLAGEELPSFLNDAAIRTLFEAGISGALTEQVKIGDCATVDRVFEVLAPLPPENMTALVTLLMEVGASRSTDQRFRLCPAA